MHRRFRLFILFLLPFFLLVTSTSCSDEIVTKKTKDNTKWNVMFYLCGSTLEQQGGYGSYKLNEIALTTPTSAVDIYVMTGGVKSYSTSTNWFNSYTINGTPYFAQSVYEMDLSGSKDGNFQYWKYTYDSQKGRGVFTEVTPVGRSMNDRLELQDFVSFCCASSPDRKNLLCVCDYTEGGLYGGILCDKTDTSSDSMSLADFGLALKNSGVLFDAVVMDTNLCQTLETALAVCDSTAYLIGSQNYMPMHGTDVSAWLNYIEYNPTCTAKELGQYICDSQALLYTSNTNYSASLTFSVADLSNTRALASSFDSVYENLADYVYYQDQTNLVSFTSNLDLVTSYGTSPRCNYDIKSASDVFLENGLITQSQYNAIISSLDSMVVYNKTGSTQEGCGLSFSLSLADSSYSDSVQSYLDSFATSSPNLKSFLELFYGLNGLSNIKLSYARYSQGMTIGQNTTSSLVIVNEDTLSVPNFKSDLIESVFINFYYHDISSNTNYYYGTKRLEPTPEGTYTKYYASENDTYGMPCLAYYYSPILSYFSNPVYSEDANGAYEKYTIQMYVTDPHSGTYNNPLVIIKDSSGIWSFYVDTKEYYSTSTDRYKSLMDLPTFYNKFSTPTDCTVRFCFVDTTKENYYYNGINYPLYILSYLSVPDYTFTEEGTISENFYYTFDYIVTDIYGSQTTIPSGVYLTT